MSNACETSADPGFDILRGSEFLTRSDRSERCRQLSDQGYLVARVAPVYDVERGTTSSSAVKIGHLRHAIEGAVEISLALRGADPPASIGEDNPAVAATDQLARLKELDATGLCLVLPELRRLADFRGTLDIADSTALDVWRELAEDEPVYLLLDDGDRDLSILAPRQLSRILGTVPPMPNEQLPLAWAEDDRALDEEGEVDDEMEGDDDEADLDDEMEASSESESEADDEADLDDEREASSESEPGASPDSLAELLGDEDLATGSEDGWGWYASQDSATAQESRSELDEPRGGSVLMADPLAGIEQLDADGDPTMEPREEALDHDDEAADDELVAEEDSGDDWARLEDDDEEAMAEGDEAPHQGSLFDADRPESRPVPSPPLKPVMPMELCRAYCADLAAASGPKPVARIEDLYRERYTPLLEAVSAGFDAPEAGQAVATWRSSFERSYMEGFNAMRLTGKRPTMVLDVPDIATRVAREHGARSVQLLLIDSLRFDLGQRLRETMTEQLAGRASCVEDNLLWSALPTVTPTQLRLLSQGQRGLADTSPPSDRDPIIQRGRSVTKLRRMRIGQRDLVKLDVVEARLREVGGGFETRMDALCEEVADVVGQYLETLAPRTLLYLFGDHGFQLPAEGRFLTGIATQGGASPEEVLVGGYGWLIDDVH